MPELGDAPVERRFAETMTVAMGAVDKLFNGTARGKDKKIGIVMLVFDYGEAEGRCNYMSNGADRKDVAVMLREQAARFAGQPEVRGNA